MRFGIDALGLLEGGQRAGVANYIYNLIVALARTSRQEHEIIVYIRKDFRELDWVANQGICIRRIPIPSWPRGIQFVARIIVEQFLLAFYAKFDRLDLMHFPDHALSLFWPLKCPRVLTIHDSTIFTHPQTHKQISRLYFQFLVPRSVSRATRIICDSNHTAKDLSTLFDVKGVEIDVIYLGVSSKYELSDESKIKPSLLRFGLDYRNYILFLGTLQPRKNIDGLIRAYGRLVDSSDISEKLVIAGRRGWFYKNIFELVEQLKLEDRVVFTDYITDDTARYLYNGATCFVYPSHYEGFGLPILEAMACGLPVIASNVSSLPEVVGEAGLLVDPTDIAQLAEKISLVINDQCVQRELRTRGLERSRSFSWDRCAERTLLSWQRACE